MQTSHKACLVLTHKLWLAKVPSKPTAVYNLIGYLSSWEEGRQLLGKCLQTALGVWSDSSSLRRMDSRQHVWICKLLVLGAACLGTTEPLKSRELASFGCSVSPTVRLWAVLYVYTHVVMAGERTGRTGMWFLLA